MNNKKIRIFECGRKLFRSKGFKDTKISEITEMAGIATGSFYNYYSSKSTLFMKIFIEENKRLKEKIMKNMNPNADPKATIEQMMIQNYKGMQKNPILREWYNREIFNKIEQEFREEQGLDQMNFLYENFISVIRKWQKENKMRDDINAEMIMAIFTSLIVVDTHKDEIGVNYFPKIMDYLFEFVIKGLTK